MTNSDKQRRTLLSGKGDLPRGKLLFERLRYLREKMQQADGMSELMSEAERDKQNLERVRARLMAENRMPPLPDIEQGQTSIKRGYARGHQAANSRQSFDGGSSWIARQLESLRAASVGFGWIGTGVVTALVLGFVSGVGVDRYWGGDDRIADVSAGRILAGDHSSAAASLEPSVGQVVLSQTSGMKKSAMRSSLVITQSIETTTPDADQDRLRADLERHGFDVERVVVNGHSVLRFHVEPNLGRDAKLQLSQWDLLIPDQSAVIEVRFEKVQR